MIRFDKCKFWLDWLLCLCWICFVTLPKPKRKPLHHNKFWDPWSVRNKCANDADWFRREFRPIIKLLNIMFVSVLSETGSPPTRRPQNKNGKLFISITANGYAESSVCICFSVFPFEFSFLKKSPIRRFPFAFFFVLLTNLTQQILGKNRLT